MRSGNLLSTWPVTKSVFLTLDFECDYGTALARNTYDAAREIETLVQILSKHNVPLSVFLQTELIDTVPSTIETLSEAPVPVEFHAHSHTHPRYTDADVPYEVSESVTRIQERFDPSIIGYRFPDGALGDNEYQLLAAEGVDFDASVFPSWRPGRFDNRDAPIYPFRDPGSDIVEIPFTVASERVRVPVSLSYLKLIGRPLESIVYRSPPECIVFGMHMHDIIVPPTYQGLPLPYKLVYRRNKHRGAAILDRFIAKLRSHNYQFRKISDLYQSVATLV